jgi:hypothetical protein
MLSGELCRNEAVSAVPCSVDAERSYEHYVKLLSFRFGALAESMCYYLLCR